MNRPTRKEIINAVAAVWERPVAAILGDSKLLVNVEPRQVAGYLLVEFGGYSSVDAADAMRRDRTTITNNRKAVTRRLEGGDDALQGKIDRVIAELAKPVVDRAKPPMSDEVISSPPPRKVVVLPVDPALAEVRRLRGLGWSLNAICRRTSLPPNKVATMIGVQLVEAGE